MLFYLISALDCFLFGSCHRRAVSRTSYFFFNSLSSILISDVSNACGAAPSALPQGFLTRYFPCLARVSFPYFNHGFYLKAGYKVKPFSGPSPLRNRRTLRSSKEGLAQRKRKVPQDFCQQSGVKEFGDSGTPKTGPVLVGQFWGLDSDRILKLVLREIISPKRFRCPQAAADVTQPIHPHLFRHQMLTYLTSKAHRRADQLIWATKAKRALRSTNTCHSNRSEAYPGCGPERGDLKRFLWDFTYLCWANPHEVFRKLLRSHSTGGSVRRNSFIDLA